MFTLFRIKILKFFGNFLHYLQVSTKNLNYMCYIISRVQKGGEIMNKIGTVTISVYKCNDDSTSFEIKTDNENVLPVSYVIEDTLKYY